MDEIYTCSVLSISWYKRHSISQLSCQNLLAVVDLEAASLKDIIGFRFIGNYVCVILYVMGWECTVHENWEMICILIKYSTGTYFDQYSDAIRPSYITRRLTLVSKVLFEWLVESGYIATVYIACTTIYSLILFILEVYDSIWVHFTAC